jgi:replicative DNA helicase
MNNPENAAAPGANRGAATSDQMAADRVQSTWIDAHVADERACVGALLIVAEPYRAGALEILEAESFADPWCAVVFRAVAAMHATGVPIDVLTAADYIESHGLLEPGPRLRMLGSSLHELTTECPIPTHAAAYAAIVARHAAQRRLVAIGRRLAAVAYGADADLIGRLMVAATYLPEVAR